MFKKSFLSFFICIAFFIIFIQTVFAYSIGDLVDYIQNLFYTATQPVIMGSTASDNCCCESTSGTRSCISRSTCWNGQGCVGNCPCSSATTTTANAACNQECKNRNYNSGTCRPGNICYSGETDIQWNGCPSYNKCCCSGGGGTTTTTQQTTTTITSQYCDSQPGYRCMPNACSSYQQPCGSTNVYSCQNTNMKCCFGTCSGASTTISSTNCCCETMQGRGCLSVNICGAACVGECPCSTTTTIPTTTTIIGCCCERFISGFRSCENVTACTTLGAGRCIGDCPCPSTTTTTTTSINSSCSYGTADVTHGVNYGDYTVYATEGSADSWAKIVVKRGTEVIDTRIINQGSYADFTSLFFRVDVTDVKETGGNIAGVDLAIGLIGIECVMRQITTTTETTTRPSTTTTGVTTSITTCSTLTTQPGVVEGKIWFDKKEYNLGESATVSWSWSNAGRDNISISNRSGLWEIISPFKRHTIQDLKSTSGSDKTTIEMNEPGEWKAELYVCFKPDCNIAQRKNVVIYEDSAIVKVVNTTGKCVPVHQSGDPSKKLDIVFLAHNYKDFSIFASDVSSHKDTLFSIEPFESNSNRINIWRVDENFDLGCYGEWGIVCDVTKVVKAASNCPADQIVVLTEFGGGGCPGYSTVNARLELVGETKVADRVTVHEFGHCFGGLFDEYLFRDSKTNEPLEGSTYVKGPNCDDSSCSSWAGMPDTGCIQNCGYKNWYRPTEQSVMNNDWYAKNFYFNPPSIRQLQNLLNAYSDQTPAPLPEPAKIYFLKFNYNKGVVTLKNISIGDGFIPDRNLQSVTGYETSLLSKSGEALQSFTFDPPKQMFYDYVDNGQLKGGIIERDNFDFVEIAPYSTDTSSINVLSQNKEVLSADFSTLAKQNKLYMATSQGDQQITLTADDASKTAGITTVKQVDIKEENAMPIYSVNGTQEAKLLFIIPVSVDVQAKVNAQNGQVISSVKSWWSAFTS